MTLPITRQAEGGSAPAIEAECRAEVLALLDREVTAWNHGDAAAYSADVDTECVMTNIVGEVFVGRAAFQAVHERILSTLFAGSRMSQAIRALHLVRPEVAVVQTDVQVTGFNGLPPGVRPGSDGVLRTRLEQVLTREAGGWRIAAYHNVDVKPATDQLG